ncbi:MAG: glycosyltransferase family 87 protein [Candidatus Dormiibacterota bacterium]
MAEVFERLQTVPAGAGGTASRRRFHPDDRSRRLGLLVLRAAALASVVAGFLTFVLAPIRGTFTGEFEDFGAYIAAAHAVAGHSDIYAQFIHQPPNVALSGFDYPPVVAFLLQPLGWVPASVAATFWLWLTIACTTAAAGIAAFELLPRAWPRLELTALASFLYSAATYNYWHGQMNPVIFLLLALALRSWLHGQQTRFGILIGVAASIKLAPIILVVLMVRRGWWQAAIACAATVTAGLVAGIAVLGFSTLHEYVTGVLPVLSAQDGWLYNQSVSGVLNRLAGHAVLTPQPASLVITLVTYAVLALMLAMLFLAVSPGMRSVRQRGAEFAAATLLMLLAGTVTWYPHYVSAIIAVFAAMAILATQPAHRSRALLWSTVVFVASTALLAPVLIANVTSWTQLASLSHSPFWWLLTQIASLPALGAAAMFVAFTVTLRRSTLAPVPQPAVRTEVASVT